MQRATAAFSAPVLLSTCAPPITEAMRLASGFDAHLNGTLRKFHQTFLDYSGAVSASHSFTPYLKMTEENVVLVLLVAALPLAIFCFCMCNSSTRKSIQSLLFCIDPAAVDNNAPSEVSVPNETNKPARPKDPIGSLVGHMEATHLRCAGITNLYFAYTFTNTGMALFVLPAEAASLSPQKSTLWVGIYLMLCGVTQLVCPVAGLLSDVHSSKYGRRRPFLAAGTLVTMAGVALMCVASYYKLRYLYAFALFSGQLALNFAYSAQCGLPADLFGFTGSDSSAADSNGLISGWIGTQTFLGAVSSMLTIELTRHLSIQVQYMIIMGVMVLCCTTVCLSAREESTADLEDRKLSMELVKEAYTVDAEEDADFIWVCVGRMFFYVSTSAVVFLYYYIRDMLHVKDEAERRQTLVVICVTAHLCGAASSLPFCWLSGRFGRKKVIYLSAVGMSLAFVLFCFAPIVSASYTYLVVYITAVIYGVGSGAYMSVDFALALDCIPQRKTVAESLGLWGLAGFLGSALGPLLGGAMLYMSPDSDAIKDQKMHHHAEHRFYRKQEMPEIGYSYFGYCMVMICLGGFANVLVMYFTAVIKKAK